MNIYKAPRITYRLIIVAACAAVAAVFAAALVVNEYVNQTYYADIQEAADVLSDDIAEKRILSHTYAQLLAKNPNFVSAVEGKTPGEIWSVGNALIENCDIDYVTITDETGIVLALLHSSPDQFGDSLADLDNLSSALGGVAYTSLGSSANIPIRVATGYPIYSGDKIVGAITMGYRCDTEEFVDGIKLKTGCEVTVFLGDTRLMTTIKSEDGVRVIGTKASKTVSDFVLAGQNFIGKAQVVGKTAITAYTPIQTDSGEIIGMFFVGKHISGATHIIVATVVISLFSATVISAVPIVLYTINRGNKHADED